MGTSKAYESPKWPGVNRAVGGAVSSDILPNQKISSAIGAFAGAYKNYLTSGTASAAKGRQNSGNSGSVARLRSASSGARLAHFISTAGKSGLDTALREFDLSDLRDKPLDEFLESVAERLSDGGGLLDDVARVNAMAETVNDLARQTDSFDEFDALLSNGKIDIEETLQVYYANILAANFEQKEYSFVRNKVPRESTSKFFAQARKIIRSIVRDELSTERELASIDWNSAEGKDIADRINQEVLEILIP